MKIITRKEAKAQGLKRYFTGKPCTRGHVAERQVSNGTCAECRRLITRKWCADNREKKLEYNRQYRAENPEYNRQYYAENRACLVEKQRQYYAENREYYNAHSAKYRAAKLDRTLAHDEELTQFVMEEAAQQARDMEEAFGTPFQVDHMIPMQGENVSGLHVWYNLQVIPAHLNISKGNRLMYTKPLEWLSDAT